MRGALIFLFEMPMDETERTAGLSKETTSACFSGTALWQTGGYQGDVP